MGKVVFFNLPGAAGHINPSLGVVKELIRRGEQVIYYAGHDTAPRLRAMGAEPRTYEPYFQYHHNAAYATDVVTAALTQLENAEKCVDGLLKDLEQDAPDYIIYDSCCMWGKYLAQRLRVPGICFITTFVSTPLAVFSDRSLGWLVAKTLVTGVPIVVNARRRIINMLEKLDLAYRGLFYHIFDIFQNEGDLNIVFLTRHFQPFGSTIPPHYKFVGASVPEGRDDNDLSLNLDGRPLVYVSLGTVHNLREEFYRTCFRAFADERYQIVMSVGQETDPTSLGPIPDNFIVRRRVPQLEVLKNASLFISHGGMNSINESLYYQVPLIMVPQQPEQDFNAKRVQRLGAGLRLSGDKVSEHTLRTYTRRILEDRRFAENAREMGQTLKAAGGYLAATEHVLDHVYQDADTGLEKTA